MVIELLPYNWEWKGISRLYKNLTASVGDIHHFAWRARHPRFAVYMSPDDARYAEWAAEECQSRCAGVPSPDSGRQLHMKVAIVGHPSGSDISSKLFL